MSGGFYPVPILDSGTVSLVNSSGQTISLADYIATTTFGGYNSSGTIATDILNISGAINPNIPAGTVLSGTTAGSITPYQIESGTIKKILMIVSGYENDTAINQTITYSTPFLNIPYVLTDSGLSLTSTETILTITAPNSITIFNGIIIIEGI